MGWQRSQLDLVLDGRRVRLASGKTNPVGGAA
jgi:hypothetical protein